MEEGVIQFWKNCVSLYKMDSGVDHMGAQEGVNAHAGFPNIVPNILRLPVDG